MTPNEFPKSEKTFPQFVAAFLLNDFTGMANKECNGIDEAMKRMPPRALREYLELNFYGFISRQQLRRAIQSFLRDDHTHKNNKR